MLQPGTILLIEDAESDAVLIREAFRKARIANPIHLVTSGAQAISYLEGSGAFNDRTLHPMPDIVLLDLGLPDMTGIALLKQIKANGQLTNIPVVIVTGSEHPSAEAEAEASGASAFFRKALKFEDLMEVVRRIGGRWGLLTPSSAAN